MNGSSVCHVPGLIIFYYGEKEENNCE